MIDFRLNKKNVKKVFKGENKYGIGLTRHRLDFLLENKINICGFFKERILGKNILIPIQKVKDNYRLIIPDKEDSLYMYEIEDIDEFIKFFIVEELLSPMNDEVNDCLSELAKYPPTGLAMIKNDAFYLYDKMEEQD